MTGQSQWQKFRMSLLAHLMRYHVRRGAEHFVLSVGYRGTQISDFFGNEFDGVPISYAVEEKPLVQVAR